MRKKTAGSKNEPASKLCAYCFLRRHYPDQVPGFQGAFTSSQPEASSTPFDCACIVALYMRIVKKGLFTKARGVV
jgi:hypothetical protein